MRSHTTGALHTLAVPPNGSITEDSLQGYRDPRNAEILCQTLAAAHVALIMCPQAPVDLFATTRRDRHRVKSPSNGPRVNIR